MIREHIYPGQTLWAAWGDIGWSAVRVLKTKGSRKTVGVERLDAKSGEVVTRTARVPISEVVKRDPKKKGADKPEEPPAKYFAAQRALEVQEEVAAPVVPAPPSGTLIQMPTPVVVEPVAASPVPLTRRKAAEAAPPVEAVDIDPISSVLNALPRADVSW